MAALDGVVISVKGDSNKTSSAKVKVGDKVKNGEQIAQVGNTGYSECPHLHFMVYPKGEEYKTLEIRFVNAGKLG